MAGLKNINPDCFVCGNRTAEYQLDVEYTTDDPKETHEHLEMAHARRP